MRLAHLYRIKSSLTHTSDHALGPPLQDKELLQRRVPIRHGHPDSSARPSVVAHLSTVLTSTNVAPASGPAGEAVTHFSTAATSTLAPASGPTGEAVSHLSTAATSTLAPASGPTGEAVSHLSTVLTSTNVAPASGPTGEAVSHLSTVLTSTNVAPASGPTGEAVSHLSTVLTSTLAPADGHAEEAVRSGGIRRPWGRLSHFAMAVNQPDHLARQIELRRERTFTD